MSNEKLPTSSALIKASPAMKAAMVLDAYTYMGEQFEKMQEEVKILSAWMECLPGLIDIGKCHTIDNQKLAEAMKQFEASRDTLTSRFVDHDKAIETFTRYLTKRQFA